MLGRVRILQLWALLFVLVGYHHVEGAATTRNASPVSNFRPPSGTGAKSSARRVMEPAFANAGTRPGIEIWRIENFKPVPYPKSDYGKFYSGDSYIVLHTVEHNGIFNWDIHFWLGTNTSQDEAGTAAVLTVMLDDQLGGDPVQYREVQEHESQQFLNYFKSGVRYLPGGVSSGFTHVDRNAFQKKLYQIKGKRNIRVKEVALSVAAMNRGDCFILDAGNDIYVYVGSKSKRTERLKAISAANLIRDQDHGGRSKIHIIDETASEVETQDFFNVLGSGSPESVPEESAGGDDAHFESAEERAVTLYSVSDRHGEIKITPVGQKPFTQSQLDTTDCFILDTADANIFVWIGKQCTKKEKDEAMKKGQQFLLTKKYPAWTQVQRIVEGAEPAIFRQYFPTWQGFGELHPRLIRSAAAKPTPLEKKSGGEVPDFMPDDGSGEVEIFRVENFELVPVDQENYGMFFGGDSYVIKYHAVNGKWIIYIWQGKDSSLDEKAAAAIHAIRMDDELGGRAIQIRVVQDNEPKHFLHIFKGKLIIFLGGRGSGFKNIKDYDTYVKGKTRMFCIRGTNNIDVRANQIIPSPKSLDPEDVFIVENDERTWIWVGKGSYTVERDLAQDFVNRLAPGSDPVLIKEGEEPDEFFQDLADKNLLNEGSKINKLALTEPKLYSLDIRPSGKIFYEEITEIEQSAFDEDDIMVLDSMEEIYFWIGKHVTDHQRREAQKYLEKFLKKIGRESNVVITVKQGQEPEGFIEMFPSYDSNYWNSALSYEEAKQRFTH